MLASHLPFLKTAPVNFSDPAGLPERTVEERIPVAVRDLRDCDLSWFFRYEIFPRRILRFFGEWQLEGREMGAGDVIVQQAQLPPGIYSMKLVFGVRVLSVERTATHAAFSYGTLEGHPEVGTNEFGFSLEDDAVIARVRTIAAPGLWVSQLLAPVFTNPYVSYCNRAALRQMTANFMEYNPCILP